MEGRRSGGSLNRKIKQWPNNFALTLFYLYFSPKSKYTFTVQLPTHLSQDHQLVGIARDRLEVAVAAAPGVQAGRVAAVAVGPQAVADSDAFSRPSVFGHTAGLTVQGRAR
jgi:hypothetical protein